jgi:hypothetical protein
MSSSEETNAGKFFPAAPLKRASCRSTFIITFLSRREPEVVRRNVRKRLSTVLNSLVTQRVASRRSSASTTAGGSAPSNLEIPFWYIPGFASTTQRIAKSIMRSSKALSNSFNSVIIECCSRRILYPTKRSIGFTRSSTTWLLPRPLFGGFGKSSTSLARSLLLPFIDFCSPRTLRTLYFVNPFRSRNNYCYWSPANG